MLRIVSQKFGAAVRGAVMGPRPSIVGAASQMRTMSHGPQESDEEFDARYVAYFSRPDIDGWEIRKAMSTLHGLDLVPEPKIIIAALHACRRVNDYALTTRFLEAVKMRCEANAALWPYILQEIKPTLTELGVSTPEELGYNKPELALQSVFDM